MKTNNEYGKSFIKKYTSTEFAHKMHAAHERWSLIRVAEIGYMIYNI